MTVREESVHVSHRDGSFLIRDGPFCVQHSVVDSTMDDDEALQKWPIAEAPEYSI